ncbi:hypothetical protein FQN05_11025 [Corynebacterium aurimucosum]|uniref:Carboxypeptidase regulatory-like domain-containing protein n=1 Tax=Corynebacterium aurimucosum TaxID=169292 RepID=A0A558IJG5_9CORY|nr:hypothetical protein [Corynebacterium aurimucosum]TVU81534.1 hypothetical protein FQN05_11025 [Corynebacterium aurimucosum]
MQPQIPVPAQVQALINNPSNLLGLIGTVLGIISLVVAINVDQGLPDDEQPKPNAGESTIQVVTSSGNPAGECRLIGLSQEKVHTTNANGVYFYALEPGSHTINATCSGLSSLSSARVLEGSQEVTVNDEPVIVEIVVK